MRLNPDDFRSEAVWRRLLAAAAAEPARGAALRALLDGLHRMVKVPSWRGRGTPRRPPQLTVPASRLLSTLRRSQGANKLAP